MIRRERLSRLILPLAFMLIFFIGVVFFVVIHMAKDNNYNNIIYEYFGISKQFHVWLMYLSIPRTAILYALNLCSIGFIISNLLFAFFFNGHFRIKVGVLFFLVISLPVLLQFFIYSPDFQRALYYGKLGFLPDPYNYRVFINTLNIATRLINLSYLMFSLFYLIITDAKWYPIKNLRMIKWLVVAGDLLLVTLYFNLFGTFPSSLLRMSRVANVESYSSVKMGQYNLLLFLSPYLIFIFFIILGVSLYKYDQKIRKIEESDSIFSSKTASAEISSRAVSHYIKNELIAILSEIDYARENENETVKNLNIIEDKCKAIYTRLDDLQRHSNRIVLEQSLCNIYNVIKEAAESVDRSLSENGISLIFEPDANREIIVFCDERYLKEVFVNLFINSIESIVKINSIIGQIIVLVEIGNAISPRVLISIEDNGHGFSRTMLEKSFEPFVSTKATKNNWGIGLSFSKRIIVNHNGNISVSNTIDGGACITIELPVVQFTDKEDADYERKNQNNDC